MASKTASPTSKRPSEARDLPHLERDLPTTAADVEALRRLRLELPRGLQDAASAYPSDPLALLARRPTSEGWEPFVL